MEKDNFEYHFELNTGNDRNWNADDGDADSMDDGDNHGVIMQVDLQKDEYGQPISNEDIDTVNGNWSRHFCFVVHLFSSLTLNTATRFRRTPF